jgi:chromate transporter
LFAFNLPFPLVVLSAGIIGYVAVRWFSPASRRDDPDISLDTTVRRGTKRAALSCLLLWVLCVGGLVASLGHENVYTEIAVFFSKMAVVTFGGAYAVLAYVAQQGVEHYHWLKPGEMLDGLALAETTPGPLILVTQFVGFLAAYREGGVEPRLLGATIGALLTTLVTFLPCFLWIFAGAPYAEKLRGHRALSGALAAITAAVVGVIANLALWFALNALFEEHTCFERFGLDLMMPDIGTLNMTMLTISAAAFLLVFVFRLGMLSLLGICAAIGVGWTFIQ